MGMLEDIESRSKDGHTVQRSQITWICSRVRVLEKCLRDLEEQKAICEDRHRKLVKVSSIALEALERRATYNRETILLRNILAGEKSIGTSTTSGSSTIREPARNVEPIL